MSVIRIQTDDNVILEIAEKISRSSGTLAKMVENIGSDDSIINVPRIRSRIVQKVFEFCEHHQLNATSDIEHNAVEKSLTDWDKNFFMVDQQTLFDIILAAAYFDIKMLFRIACYHVAKQVSGKTTEELRVHFALPNDINDDKIEAAPEEPKQSNDEAIPGKKRPRRSSRKSAGKK